MPLPSWFWDRYDRTGDCWLFKGVPNKYGYATIKTDGHHSVYGHRAAYEELVGSIPDGFQIDHLCKVRICANPDHLEAVPQWENIYRGNGVAVQKMKQTHCIHGHEFTPENTIVRKDRPTTRECRECGRISSRERKRKARAVASALSKS